MKFIAILFFLFSNGTPLHAAEAGTDKATTLLWQNLNCFINSDLKACTANVTSDGSQESDYYYLRFGCVEKNSPELCVLFGNWAARRGLAAEDFYKKACNKASHAGCLALFELQSAKAKPGMTPQALAPLIQQATETYQVFCGVAQPPANCLTAADRIKQMSTLDQEKPCALRLWTMAGGGEAPELTQLDEPPAFLKNCLAKCAYEITRFDFAKNPAREVRGQCLFDGKPSGEAQWNFRPIKPDCDMKQKSMAVGSTELSFYSQCNCEGRRFTEFNTAIAKLGFFASADAGNPKSLSGQKWYRCGMHLTATEKLDPACVANLEKIRQLAKADPQLRDYEIRTDGLVCKK